MNRIADFGPMDAIVADGMSPGRAQTWIPSILVVLIEEVVLAIVMDGPVGIVDPVRGAGQVVDGTTRIGGRSLRASRDARVGAIESAPMLGVEWIHEALPFPAGPFTIIG